MRYGRHTSREFQVIAVIMVVVWVITAFFTSQETGFDKTIQSNIQTIFGKPLTAK